MKCVAAFDNDELAIQVHQQNLKSPAYVADLSGDNQDLSALKNVDVLLAGPPCQAFSSNTMGRHAETDHPRRLLLLVAGKIALRVRPKVFLVENVMGLVSQKHKQWWHDLGDMLRAGRYRTHELCCDASTMGVPQKRRRVFMIAWRTRADPRFDLPYLPGGVLATALRGLRGTPNHSPQLLPEGSEGRLIASHVRQGQKVSNARGGTTAIHTWDIPEVFGTTNNKEKVVLETLLRLRRQIRRRTTGDADPVVKKDLERKLGEDCGAILESLIAKKYVRKLSGAFDLVWTYNGKYRRLRADVPSLTVDTRFTNPHHFLHPYADRGFTVREAARIQGFPDSFVFPNDGNREARLVGNAVPPPLARILARVIRDRILIRN